MKNSLTLLFAIFVCLNTSAQHGNRGRGGGAPSITGKITGTVLDSLSNVPIEFASVVLINAKNGKEVDGTISNEKGEFKFPEVKLGVYKVHFSFIGYAIKEVPNIRLLPAKPDFDMGNIRLFSEAKLLETVTVTGQAAIIESKIDRIVYHADKDVDADMGNAADVLRKVPLLSVDLDGNLSLRGSSNVKVLINGKPSGIFSSNLADALKMFPANQIKSVEVITVPSAKYDGEGTAGIINIITKRKQINGYAGSVSTTAGTRHTSTSLNLNVAKGRFGLSGGGYAVWSPPRDAIWDFDREDILPSGAVRTLKQDGVNSSERLGFHGKFGAYYDFNAYNSINSNLTFGGANFNRDWEIDAILSDPESEFGDEVSHRENPTKTVNNSFDWNTDYTRKFADSEREFSVGFQLSKSIDNAAIILLQTGNQDFLRIDEISDNDSKNLETTLQVDYVHPFTKNIKLETGAKGILRTINSDFYFDDFNFDSGQYERDPMRSDQFDYQQDVYAGYASLNAKIGEKFGVIAGARYERTEIQGDFAVEDNKAFANDYYNVLPTVIVSRKMGEFSNLRASYSQRIQRPSLRFINPYVSQQDRNNISFGNPELDPELSHNFELGYDNYIKGVVVSASGYYRYTTDIIESILAIDGGGTSFTTYKNAGVGNTFGISFFSSANIKKVLTLRGNFDIRYRNLKSNIVDLDAKNSGFEVNGNASSTISFPKEIRLQFWGMFNSPTVTLQGTRANFWMYSISLQKKIWGKRGSIGIKTSNLFHRSLNFDTVLEGENFTQSNLNEYPFRSYGINFNYLFGKLDFKGGERKSKVKNTDQKKGDSNTY